jgi:hypothetical protein
MLTPDDRSRITALLSQIDAIYKEAQQRPSHMVCDICGAGDHHTHHAIFKVKDDAHGYERRQADSPRLCHRHFGGWALSFQAFSPMKIRTDQEIDLHFALYLAKQLTKESQRRERLVLRVANQLKKETI